MGADGKKSEKLMIPKNGKKACFRIGAKGGTPLKIYYLKFTQSDKSFVDVPLL